MATRYFDATERAFASGPEMHGAMWQLVDGIADDAREGARNQGLVGQPVSRGGAASIHGEVWPHPDGWEGRVSWARSKFWMYFHEKGTETLPARPFLRPAIERRRQTL